MIAATPASVERAFAQHGVLLTRAVPPPEICYQAGCSTLLIWGGKSPVYFTPPVRRDFVVVLFQRPSDAARIAAFETKSGLGTERRGTLVLLYNKLSARVARLRSALASVQ